MNWNQQITIKPLFVALMSAGVFVLVIGFYKEISFLFSLGVIILLLYATSLMQFKLSTRDLGVEQNKQVYRLFPGDQDEFYIKLVHTGKWPSYRGEVTLSHHDIISSSLNEVGSQPHGKVEQTRPFVINKRTAYEEKVSFVAKKRGITKISNLTLRIDDPMQTSLTTLNYQSQIPLEFIVYPSPMIVQGIEQLFQEGSGNKSRPFALYENDSLPAGNRDYTSGDSFHRMHWKATARTGTLQTKLFEKSVVYHWTFVYTIQHDHKGTKSTDTIEREISYLAFMCQYATVKGIPFELYINVRVPGPSGLYHLSSESGPDQLSRIFEGLARIDRFNIPVMPDVMWKRIDQNLYTTPFIILLGHIPSDSDSRGIMNRWIRRGGKVFYVDHSEGGALLRSYSSLEVLT
ncbi:DUF58 domain-containing protein [Fictibacillus sp. BK138]|uniref:DUF58 domain-containing protein n=1 Tax=Fictibacillus sp. BK138 TaxID=2512121 RepID=UPI00102A828E|nr:DUF58 domain-containing protein [Fictibacillus sp. BK138]RZT15548.1 uncharacterized protein (DUF58 family) [Fictibacillus sp. BK138]